MYIIPDYKEDPRNCLWCSDYRGYVLASNDLPILHWTIIFDWEEFWRDSFDNTATDTNMEAIVQKLFDDITRDTQSRAVQHLQIVGLGLGAHIAGITAQKLKPGLHVDEIVALDPSGGSFVNSPESKRLSKDDARFVRVYHTNPGKYGYSNSLGSSDFYARNYPLRCKKDQSYQISTDNTRDGEQFG